MDSDGDSGSDDSMSISDSSDGSSSQDEERLEPARILGTTLELPQDLCENPDIFKEFFSIKTWNSLSEANVQHLKKFLPTFAENDEEEKNITVQKLFARETFNFTSPLVEFHHKLRDGAYRPDIARMQKVLQKARNQHTKHQWRLEWHRTMQEVLVSRERLLAVAHALPPGAPAPRAPLPSPAASAPPTLLARTKRRYFQELAAIRSEVCGEEGAISDDENFPEGPPPPLPKNHRKQFMTLQGGADAGGIVSTLGPSHKAAPNFSEEWRRRALIAHRRLKQNQPDNSELITTGITLASIRGRSGPGGPPSPTASPPAPRARRPPRRPPPPRPPSPSSSASEPDEPPVNIIYKPAVQPPPPLPPRPITPVTVKVEQVPVEDPVIPEETGVELVQETHACFLSVVRDLVCGTPNQCLPLPALAVSLRHWRQNPIAPLNHWYSSVEDWLKALPSAVSFLAGDSPFLPEDFVPYLQYKPATQVYQWIGAGRDSDALLTPLCAHWLAHRQAANAPPPPAPQPPTPAPTPTSEAIDRASSPPVTKWNTRWQVSGTELESFRTQERARFQRPHRAFTYRLPRGRAVVGPLKGVYACEETSGGRGARGHSLLAPSRPRHVTLLALVRDAVACLPSGEGTRAHITALLRRSQYLVAGAGEQALQAAVSGALDRMHGAPDPCVRYLPARKLWLYLHRERTEEEFERLHAEVQVQGKIKSASTTHTKRNSTPSKPRSRPKAARAEISAPLIAPPAMLSPGTVPGVGAEEELDGEDANVDVEGPEPIPQLALPIVEPPPPPVIVTNVVNNVAPPLVPTEKVNMVVSTVSSTSLLQPRATVMSSTIMRQASAGVAGARSMVRVLSPATAASGKSLISPRAFRPSTSPPGPRVVTTQAKVVLQRPAGQTTGALSPAHQRILLESLMQHQRTHGQPMSRDQLLHTIHSTQKMSSSPPVTPGTSPAPTKAQTPAIGQTIQLAGQTVQLASGQTVQLAGQTVQLTGQTVQLTGQTVQLGGQTVQLAGQTVQLGGQTVQLGGQTVQLTGQQISRPGGDIVRAPAQRHNTPLIAKILTNAQVRSGNNVTTSRMTGNTTGTGGLRLTGLNLGQLQGKPVLLHTSSANANTSNLILQASANTANAQGAAVVDGAAGTRATPTTTQHTILLSNIGKTHLGGQVVRVASGGGTLLGPALRLQATSPASPIQGRAGNTGMLLGSQALKLQASPIRLHQGSVSAAGPGSTGKVLLASGARLHGLKLLPVNHQLSRGGAAVGNRQVYARIVSPAGTVSAAGGSVVGSLGLRAPVPGQPAPSAPSTPRNQ